MTETLQAANVVPCEIAPSVARVRFCTWCKEVCVRDQQPKDFITVYICGEMVKVLLNGREIIAGDGICEACRQKHFPETVKSGVAESSAEKSEENSNDKVSSV